MPLNFLTTLPFLTGFNAETVNNATNWVNTFVTAFWGLLGAVLGVVAIIMLFSTIPSAMAHARKKEWKETALSVIASVIIILLAVGGAVVAVSAVRTIFGSTSGQTGGANFNMYIPYLINTVKGFLP